MKARLVKCPVCGKQNPKDETTLLNKRYYCPPCAEAKEQAKANKPKTGWDELYQYLVQLYGHPPTGQMYQQLKQYRNEYGYTDLGMYYSLKYYYETVKAPLHQEKGLGIIPYIYEEAKQHYAWLGHLKVLAEAFTPVRESVSVVGRVETTSPKRFAVDYDQINWEINDENDENDEEEEEA